LVVDVDSTVYNYTMGDNEPTSSLAAGTKGLEHMSGKGSRPRPYSVGQKQFESNWDIIFGNKKKLTKLSDSDQDQISKHHQETPQAKLTNQSQGQS
jgi:hypothetical protein